MKFIVSLILTGLLSFAACLYLPWWSISIVAFVVAALIPQKPLASFLSGFTGLFILWISLSTWISNANEHILAHKISMLIIKMDNVVMLVLVTALIGALVAGMGALTGSFLRKKQVPKS
ncbi:MAG: hypothetical protein H7Y86_04870 [Rhizobacter sp.]|nr:hypothetical protein [Ferruginibacter sp.]